MTRSQPCAPVVLNGEPVRSLLEFRARGGADNITVAVGPHRIDRQEER